MKIKIRKVKRFMRLYKKQFNENYGIKILKCRWSKLQIKEMYECFYRRNSLEIEGIKFTKVHEVCK